MLKKSKQKESKNEKVVIGANDEDLDVMLETDTTKVAKLKNRKFTIKNIFKKKQSSNKDKTAFDEFETIEILPKYDEEQDIESFRRTTRKK